MQDTPSVRTLSKELKQLSRSSSRWGADEDACAVFHPSHGTAPDIAGKGIANSIATILSAAMMLEWPGHPELLDGATRIPCAVETVLVDPANRMPDTGGRLSTQPMTEKMMEHL